MIPESRREASLRTIDKFDFSKPKYTSSIFKTGLKTTGDAVPSQ